MERRPATSPAHPITCRSSRIFDGNRKPEVRSFGASPIADHKPITKWNILALLVLLVGGTATLALDQLWLRSWFHSGIALPIGQRLTVDLPAGQTLVYYESPVSVPASDVSLRMTDSDGERMPVQTPGKDISYRMMFTGWSGRALWNIRIPRPDRYTILCFNHNVMNDADIPAEDRVVFFKNPNSLAEMTIVRTFIEVTGATATCTLVIVFYILHGLALRKRRQTTAPLR